MGEFRKLPVVIEAITFEQFVQYGKDNGANIVNDMPWSFNYNGHPVTHENDECYLIPTLEGTYNFTPKDVLITGVKGEIYPCKKDIFEATYEKVYAPHQERVVLERTELIEKITKLHAFFKTEIFENLQEEDQNLLEDQVQLMMDYSDVLLKRINRF